jgi:catechol 2,3-dioxygenase-like lactoylglutathione lyase family enzyme
MSEAGAETQKIESAPLTAIVAMIRVADVAKSAEFYRLFGFEIGNREPKAGDPHWAWLYSPGVENWKRGPNLMLTCGNGKPDPRQVLFYLYASDLQAMRERLKAKGVQVGEIEHPEYLPEGEFRTEDPDGYVLMVAQAGKETP